MNREYTKADKEEVYRNCISIDEAIKKIEVRMQELEEEKSDLLRKIAKFRVGDIVEHRGKRIKIAQVSTSGRQWADGTYSAFFQFKGQRETKAGWSVQLQHVYLDSVIVERAPEEA